MNIIQLQNEITAAVKRKDWKTATKLRARWVRECKQETRVLESFLKSQLENQAQAVLAMAATTKPYRS